MRIPPTYVVEPSEPAPTALEVLTAAGRLGHIVKVETSDEQYYLIRHPSHIKHVLQDKQRNYRKLTRPYEITNRFFGGGLVNAEDEGWLARKRMLQPAFHPGELSNYVEGIQLASKGLLDRLDQRVTGGGLVEIRTELTATTAAVITRMLFDEELHDFAIAWNELIDAVLSSQGELDGDEVARELAKADALVYAKLAHARSTGLCGPMLASFLAARDATTAATLTDQELRDEVVTLVFAGVESTASKLSWSLTLLARHPDICDAVCAELATVLGSRPATIDDVKHLSLLRMVLHESMRIYPPAWSISRRAVADDLIDGYCIPAGSNIVVSQWVTHRCPDYWPDPEVFDPQRFTPERVAARPKYAYFPFLGGTHRCIGEHVSMLEATLIMSSVLRRYRFRPSPFLIERPTPRAMLQPRFGLWLVVEPRPAGQND